MSKQFITLSLINKDLVDYDTQISLRADVVSGVIEATDAERKHRREINSLVMTENGGMYACGETIKEVMERIEACF